MGRLAQLVAGAGPLNALVVLFSAIDDRYLKLFDRVYRIRTSGSIRLHELTFTKSRLADATRYGPVNGWGFRRLLKELALPRAFQFVDFGCGLARPCVLAAEYGFARVTGVELSPELCAGAVQNVASCRRLSAEQRARIHIVEGDVLDYCDRMEEDVVFMFRPFSRGFLQTIFDRLVARVQARQKPLTIIYSERMVLSEAYGGVVASQRGFRKLRETAIWGQAFFVYQCDVAPVAGANLPATEPRA